MAPKRLTDPLAAKARRQELQRGYVKASYNRKKQAIADLRAEVESLQCEFRELSARSVTVEDGATSDTHTDTEGDDRHLDSARQRMLQRLYAITQTIAALRKENIQLHTENDEWLKIEAHLQQLVENHQALSSIHEQFAYISLPYEAYYEIIARTQDHAMRFFYDDAKLSTGSSIFGWRDYRTSVKSNMFDFAFEKEFTPWSAAALADSTWKLLTSPASYTALYDRAMNAKIYSLQQIDRDTYLFHSILQLMPGVAAKAVFLLSRVAIDGGHLIVLCDVDPKHIYFCDNDIMAGEGSMRVEWHKMRSWVIVQEKAADRTLFHYGGTNHVAYVLEVLLIALRWQTKVIGPLMVLPPSE